MKDYNFKPRTYENIRRLETYNGAVRDWGLNRDRCIELGLPIPPRPKAPMLEYPGGEFDKVLTIWGSAHA